MRTLVLGLITLSFSSMAFAYDYCDGLDEYSAIFKKEISIFQAKLDKDTKDPGVSESSKKKHIEALASEKDMCQTLVKKHKLDNTRIFNDGVSNFMVKESAIMYREGMSEQQLNSSRMLLTACYCQLRGLVK